MSQVSDGRSYLRRTSVLFACIGLSMVGRGVLDWKTIDMAGQWLVISSTFSIVIIFATAYYIWFVLTRQKNIEERSSYYTAIGNLLSNAGLLGVFAGEFVNPEMYWFPFICGGLCVAGSMLLLIELMRTDHAHP